MRKDKNESGLVTAYQTNTRSSIPLSRTTNSGWGCKIDRLFDLDYSFLPYGYTNNGILFRAMNSGLLEAIRSNSFGQYISENPHSALEQELEVFFISHELSDALTVARLWEEVNDAGLICFPSNYFNQQNIQQQAAVMAFSEPGFVFKYPFLTEPITFDNIDRVMINFSTYDKLQSQLGCDEFAKISNRLFVINESIIQAGRKMVETIIEEELEKKQLKPALPIKIDHYPKK